jgi:hypothetical protein
MGTLISAFVAALAVMCAWPAISVAVSAASSLRSHRDAMAVERYRRLAGLRTDDDKGAGE